MGPGREREREIGPSIHPGQLEASRNTPGLRGSLPIYIYQCIAGDIMREYTEKLEWEQDQGVH